MRKEKIKQLVDVMQAYVNGKTIQYYDVDLSFKIEHPGEPNFNDKWVDVDEDHLFRPDFYNYRVKPEPRYRSFKNAEECWQEMERHQPFGVVKDKYFANYQTHRAFTCLVTNGCHFRGYEDETFESSFKNLLFADGTPFGVKIDE